MCSLLAGIEEMITLAERRQYMKWLNGQGRACTKQTLPPAQPEQEMLAESWLMIWSQDEQEPWCSSVKGMRVNTPAGLGTVSIVGYCERLKPLRCLVFADARQPNGSYWAVVKVSQVQPINQGTLLSTQGDALPHADSVLALEISNDLSHERCPIVFAKGIISLLDGMPVRGTVNK
jgi:hypothetical protein